MLKRILIIFFVVNISVFATGCAHNNDSEFNDFINKTQVLPIESIKLNIPDVRPVKMKPVKWKVVTKENAIAVLNTLEESGKTPILFGISDDDYENLSLNMIELQNYIDGNVKILIEYRKYYETNN